MSERELTTDDYLAMLRRRLKVILIPALVAPLTGFLVSYASFLPPRYTSTSTVLVEGQKVPDQYVQSVIAADFAQRVQTLSQEILSPAKLRPVIHSLNLVKPEEEGKLIGQIQQTLQVEPVMTSMSAAAAAGAKKKPTASNEPVPGFSVAYTDNTSGVRAQKVCNALTSMIVDENLRSRSDVAQSTTDFLGRQLEEAKRTGGPTGRKTCRLQEALYGSVAHRRR
jgi:polysaccharide biosynthesis transport protein